jgi:hypothetical protein
VASGSRRGAVWRISPTPGKKDQDVARAQVEDPAHGFGRALGDRQDPGRDLRDFLIHVADLDRMAASPAFDDRASAEICGDRPTVEYRRQDRQFQLRADGLSDTADHGQGEVAAEVPLVELVEHDRAR